MSLFGDDSMKQVDLPNNLSQQQQPPKPIQQEAPKPRATAIQQLNFASQAVNDMFQHQQENSNSLVQLSNVACPNLS